MIALWRRIWAGEPVVIVGALTSGWTAVAAFDVASNEFAIPIGVYVAAAVLVPVLTVLARGKVSPTDV